MFSRSEDPCSRVSHLLLLRIMRLAAFLPIGLRPSPSLAAAGAVSDRSRALVRPRKAERLLIGISLAT